MSSEHYFFLVHIENMKAERVHEMYVSFTLPSKTLRELLCACVVRCPTTRSVRCVRQQQTYHFPSLLPFDLTFLEHLSIS